MNIYKSIFLRMFLPVDNKHLFFFSRTIKVLIINRLGSTGIKPGRKNSTKGILGKVNKYAHKFDYDDGILSKRLPMFLTMMTAYYGIAAASRNKTEMKYNLIRSCAGGGAFFGGDIIIGSILARLSDKFLKTEIIDKNCRQNWLNKILPPVKHLKDLNGKSKNIGTLLFWINMASLSAIIGFGVPAAMNKMIKKDVDKTVYLEYN